MDRHYRTTHNGPNTEVTVERQGRKRTYPIEFARKDDPEGGTASMIAVGKFLAEFSLAGAPVDQVRDHRRERGGSYCANVRVAG